MSAPPDLIVWLRKWVSKAEADLRNAEHTLLLVDYDCPFETVGFHAQQCAEKYLKALIVAGGRNPPRTHDLDALFDLLRPDGLPGLGEGELAYLTPFGAEFRYPGDFEPSGRADAEKAMDIARRVRAAARATLPPAVFETES